MSRSRGGGGAHRRSALRLAASVLGAGWLGLAYLQHGSNLSGWLLGQAAGRLTLWLGLAVIAVTLLYLRLRTRLTRRLPEARPAETKRTTRNRIRFPAAPEE